MRRPSIVILAGVFSLASLSSCGAQSTDGAKTALDSLKTDPLPEVAAIPLASDRICDRFMIELHDRGPEAAEDFGFSRELKIDDLSAASSFCSGRRPASGPGVVDAVVLVDTAGEARLILSEHAKENPLNTSTAWIELLAANGHPGASESSYGYSTVDEEHHESASDDFWKAYQEHLISLDND